MKSSIFQTYVFFGKSRRFLNSLVFSLLIQQMNCSFSLYFRRYMTWSVLCRSFLFISFRWNSQSCGHLNYIRMSYWSLWLSHEHLLRSDIRLTLLLIIICNKLFATTFFFILHERDRLIIEVSQSTFLRYVSFQTLEFDQKQNHMTQAHQ